MVVVVVVVVVYSLLTCLQCFDAVGWVIVLEKRVCVYAVY